MPRRGWRREGAAVAGAMVFASGRDEMFPREVDPDLSLFRFVLAVVVALSSSATFAFPSSSN